MADGIAGLLDAQGNIDLTKIRGLLAPQPTDRREAALLMGLGLLGTRGGQEGEAFQRAAAMGLTSQQQAMRQRQESIQSAAQIMQMQRFAQQMADEQKARQIMAGIPLAGMQQPTGGLPQPFPAPGGGGAAAMMNAGLGSAPPPTTMLPTQQPAATGGGITKKQVSDYFAAAAMQFSRAGLPGQAKDALEMAVKNQPEVQTSKIVTDPASNKRMEMVLFKDGSTQILPYGPDLEKAHFGATATTANIPLDPFTGQQLGPGMPMGISPADQQRIAIERGNLGLSQQRLGIEQQRLGIEQQNVGINRTQELRKEFNALPQVKMYNEVQPIVQSAREATKTDTPAADLNLIYAAAKIMDPGSVVRESETSMVIATGSPAQKFLGQFNYVAGGGRLTGVMRDALMNEIESRARGYESGYKAARQTYSGIADKLNLPKEDVFVEPFTTSPTTAKAASGGGGALTAAEKAELDQLRKRFGRR